jgi:type VI secretion system protein ImpA
MPLRDDLLNPIAGDNPCGESLRYAAIYDKIKEARREEDDAPQGEWQHERKTADFPSVIKMAGEALATKTKDIQLAVWLTEALYKTESFAGLRAGLGLIRGLIEQFWDNLYPEIEDGDLELRAGPLDWLGSRHDSPLRTLPITRGGQNWFQFREARAVGYEAEAEDDSTKKEAREAAIAEGKITGEDWDHAFNATPKSYYINLESTLDSILESIESLSGLCGEKFGNDAPSFNPLRTTIEEIRHTVHGLLQKKRETEPDEVPESSEDNAENPEEAPEDESSRAEPELPVAAAPPKARTKGKQLPPEPVDRDDAIQRVISVASYLRREDPSNTTPYLLLRGLRFGELRNAGSDLDLNLLEAPSTDIRQTLKKAANESEWSQVMEKAETAMETPCGRGWLDLQRYVYRAAYELGYSQIQTAVRAEVVALLGDYPDLRQAALLDDTPAANPETQAWLDEMMPPRQTPADESAVTYTPPPIPEVAERTTEDARDAIRKLSKS